ncbi:MAG TPA: MobF family relaxase [Nitriliruptorales bacterium]
MRATTLKATAGGLSGLVAYYAGLADRPSPGDAARGPVDYYLDPDEPPGRWWGGGQAGFGVHGVVEGDELRAMLEGRHPRTGTALGRAFGERSARGFDATFSAPKSVSVLWALSPDPWVRAEVLASHDRAVEVALGWFQQHGAVTRRGTDGVNQVDTLGITAAVFRQHTSRTIDPQLHSHALIVAKVQDPTGRWLSLDARFLKCQQRTIGWVYDAALRAELTERLGVLWGPMVGGQAELTAVPAEVRDLFSQRSAQVKAARDALIAHWSTSHDGAEPDARTIARLERAAVLASRPDKTHGIDAAELHDVWARQARGLGLDLNDLTPEHLTMRRDGPDSGPPLGPNSGPEIDPHALGTEALRRVGEETATWLPADLARHVATLVPASVGTADDLLRVVDDITERTLGRCVELSPARSGPRRTDGRPVAEHVVDRRLTTPELLRQEQYLQDWAMGHAYHLGPASGDPQADASAAIAGPAQLVVVVGPAGTGKTRTVATAVAQLADAGRPVVGLAPSGKAADVLHREAGCPTDTLAGFLTRHRGPDPSPWPARTTVIVDEAGMANTQDLLHLVGHARRHHWRIVAVGDPAQLPAVGRGGVFAHWCDTVPRYDLDTPRRFVEPWEAEASLELRRGAPDVAETYAAHDRLHTVHPALLASRLAREHQRHVEAGRTVAITTVSAATARDINHAIQALTPPAERGFGAEIRDGARAYVGDQIATRRNDPTTRTTHDDPVRNRQTWTVDAIDAGGRLTVSHPERGTAVLSPDYAREHVELGWAVTGYGNQGDTVDIGLAVLEPGATRQHAYVALTRGREANHAIISDPTDMLDPAEHLQALVTPVPARESALAVRDALHAEAGLMLPASEPDLSLSLER